MGEGEEVEADEAQVVDGEVVLRKFEEDYYSNVHKVGRGVSALTEAKISKFMGKRRGSFLKTSARKTSPFLPLCYYHIL